jgi:hypothetical protein
MVKTNWKEMMRKVTILAYFKALYRILDGGAEENHQIFQSVLSVHGLNHNRALRIVVRSVAA